jgi:hypothetical protein
VREYKNTRRGVSWKIGDAPLERKAVTVCFTEPTLLAGVSLPFEVVAKGAGEAKYQIGRGEGVSKGRVISRQIGVAKLV